MMAVKMYWMLIISVIFHTVTYANGHFCHAHEEGCCKSNFLPNNGMWANYYQTKECKCPTYVFGVHETPISRWNGRKGEFEGVFIEIAKRVCEYAKKSCEFSLVPKEYCWDDEEGISLALNGRWYDGCLPVADAIQRKASYAFAENGMFTLGNLIVYGRAGSNITEEDLRDPTNNFIMAYSSAQDNVVGSFLEAFFKAGLFIKPQNLVPIATDLKNTGMPLAEQISGCESQDGGPQVDLVLFLAAGIPPFYDFVKVAEIPSKFMGSLMVRKDNKCLLDWWDAAFKKLICSDEYPELCQKWSQEIGNFIDGCVDRTFCNGRK